MKSSQLFLKIKKDMERCKSKVENKNISENPDSIDFIMSKYNQDNFNEIMDLSFLELDDEIDEEKLNDFQKRIDYFFSLYSPDDEKFRDFIKAISLYLAFFAKKPLHPPEIKFSDGKGVYKEQDIYYCTEKANSLRIRCLYVNIAFVNK